MAMSVYLVGAHRCCLANITNLLASNCMLLHSYDTLYGTSKDLLVVILSITYLPLLTVCDNCVYRKEQLYEHTHAHTRTHIHTRLTALCPGLSGWAGTRKVKPIWILLKQETMSGSGISWAICKSEPRSRQITMHTSTPPLSFLQAGCPSCRPTNSVKAVKARTTLWNK